MITERLFLMDIETGDRLRAVDPAKVSAIKVSVAEIGLRTPITVSATQVGDEWRHRLVAGAHRLEALRQLGEEYAECFVMEGDPDDALLWEIDENFARAELTDAQRADHHVRREEILKRKGLVRPQGRPGKDAKSAPLSYADQAAASLGVSKRTVQQDLARGKKIDAEVLAEVAGTSLDKGVVLDELARTPAEEQRAKLAEITLRRQEAERTRKEAEAATRATDRVVQMTDAERFAEWIMARTDLNELPTIISWIDGTKPADVSKALRRLANA